MKIQAAVVFKFQAGSLAEAGAVLDEVLAPARGRDDVDVGQLTVTTPAGSAPVSLPAVSTPGEYPPGRPYPEGVNGG
jgi:hypothetical protein